MVSLVPQRTYLSHEFSDHVSRQAGDPPVADDRCTRRVPHHTTMIDDRELDASPPTVHELVRRVPHRIPGPRGATDHNGVANHLSERAHGRHPLPSLRHPAVLRVSSRFRGPPAVTHTDEPDS
ncbi:hypothetical protein SSBG_02978 [Streptomyces sp. SPB074]|nr:hypothetical protein SSBG_02978 [Streptomyces sp. SPB074]